MMPDSPVRPLTDSPNDWDDVDHLVERMGRLEMELAVLDAEYSEQLYNLLGAYRDRVADLVRQRNGIEKTVQGFCEGRKADFAKKRSRKLTYGKVSFRVSERVLVPKGKEQIVVTTLLALGLTDCVRISQKLDRDALKKLSETNLARAGIRREKYDHFKVEPDLSTIASELGGDTTPPAKPKLDLGKLVEAIGAKAA